MGYTTDLTLRQRSFIFEKFPEIFKTKSKADIFEILNALFYIIKMGCQWQLLPKDFPKWRTVYEFYRKWISLGFFDRLIRELNAVARKLKGKYPMIRLLKVDYGYRGSLVMNLREGLHVELECVKSNFGTSEFKPINGRWVVERTFSWLESFRRLNRNYEQFLHTAKGIAMAACAMFMLRFI